MSAPGARRRGPGPVAAAHRVLITAALLCALVYAAWERHEYVRGAGPLALLRVGVALAAAVAIGLYLRSLRTLAARLAPPEEEERERHGPPGA